MRYREVLAELNALRYDQPNAIKKGKQISFEPTPDEKKAVTWYTDGGYHNINATLRGLDAQPVDPKQQQTDYGFDMDTETGIKHLNDIIAKAPKRKKVVHAFRGESSASINKKLLEMEIGESIHDPSFLSASLSATYAYYSFASAYGNKVLSMFIVPPSIPMAYISNDIEMEVLFPRGMTRILKGKRVIPNKDRPQHGELILLIWDLKL